MKRIVLTLCIVLLSASVMAEWTFVKRIDCSPQADATNSRLRELCADASGNLYFNTYFGTPTDIFKVSNPLSDTPTITTFCSPSGGLGSTYTGLVVDDFGNLYTGRDTADYNTSWMEKYDSSGNLVTTFGSNGRVSPIAAGGTEANRRPWHLTWTGPSTHKILITLQKGRPEQLALIDANTGANAATNPVSLTTFGDQDNDGNMVNEIAAYQIDPASTAATTKYFGHAYDEVTNTIYGNSGHKLVKVTASGTANLADLSTFDTYAVVSGSAPFAARNESVLAFERAQRLIAYTKVSASPAKIAIWDITAESEVLVGNDTGDGVINSPYGLAFFTSGTDLYLAVNDNAAGVNDIVIYRKTPSNVDNWEQY